MIDETIEVQDVGGTAVSPWVMALKHELTRRIPSIVFEAIIDSYKFQVRQTLDSLWIIASWPEGGQVLFRAAFCPGVDLSLRELRQNANELDLQLISSMGLIRVEIEFPAEDFSLLHWKTFLSPGESLTFGAWPGEVYLADERGDPTRTKGKVYPVSPVPGSVLLLISLNQPRSGSLLYARLDKSMVEEAAAAPLLSPFNGSWPELGFQQTFSTPRPLAPDQEALIAESVVRFSQSTPADRAEAASLFASLLSDGRFQSMLKKPM